MIAGAIVFALTQPGAAQQFSSFGNARVGTGLTNADSDLLGAATQAVNSKMGVQQGDAQSWSNPKSGNSGMVTVTRLFTSSGLACHSLQYANVLKGQAPPPAYSVNWCDVGDGVWKIKS